MERNKELTTMATIAQLIAHKFKQRAEQRRLAELHAHPIDKDVPLGLHIDGKVEIHPQLNAGLVMPDLGQVHLVQAFSRGSLDGTSVFKVYLRSETGDNPSYLQIMQDAEDCAVRWFAGIDTVYPGKDWDLWISKENGLIGYPQFQLQNEAQTLYDRVWDPGNTQLAPVSFVEKIFTDRYDESQQMQVEHSLMLYGRKVDDPSFPRDELLLVSKVHDSEGSYVVIEVGIDLDPKLDLKVQF
jgi:hypothetical protein